MQRLRDDGRIASRALELLTLCASRTGEVLGAKWSEFDLGEKVWTVPGERTKGGRVHRVALSDRAVAILKAQRRECPSDEFVFPGRRGQPLSDMTLTMLMRRLGLGHYTVHGLRSTFRDWVAERTNFPNEVAEMALAHAIDSKVEAAYRRGDLLQKRFQLAEAWSKFCAMPAVKPGKNVVAMRRGGDHG